MTSQAKWWHLKFTVGRPRVHFRVFPPSWSLKFICSDAFFSSTLRQSRLFIGVHPHVAIHHTHVPVTHSLIQTHLHVCLPTEMSTLRIFQLAWRSFPVSSFAVLWVILSSKSEVLFLFFSFSEAPQAPSSHLFAVSCHQLTSIRGSFSLPWASLLPGLERQASTNCFSSAPGSSPRWVLESLLQSWRGTRPS